MTDEAWSPIDVGEGRWLVYGPRFGRSYLLEGADALGPHFLKVVGLRREARYDSILDPAQSVSGTRYDVMLPNGRGASQLARGCYSLLGMSRHIVPLRLAARLVRTLALVTRRCGQTQSVVQAIARRLHETEQGRGDCYPRALMTAYLSLRAGHACTLTIGALAPTRKMHVWCSLDGIIPYEPSPEHYLYQPLWTMALEP